MDWVSVSVRYWYGRDNTIVSVTAGEWSRLPTNGVVDVSLHYGRHSMTLNGHDNYAIEGDEVYVWTDPDQEHADPNRTGQRYKFVNGVPVESESINYIPQLKPENIKRGVMLPDELARQIGMID